MRYIYYIVFLFLSLTPIVAQVQVEGTIRANGNNILLSIYSPDAHQLVQVSDAGTFSCILPRYEECILIAYGIHSLPEIVSVNTEDACQEIIHLNFALKKGSIADKGYLIPGPKQRIVTNTGAYQSTDFELDNVVDKKAYAKVMAALSKEMKVFYEKNAIPKERFATGGSVPAAEITKTEHQIGQEIFGFINKKKQLQKELQLLQTQYQTSETFTTNQCSIDLTLLKKEALFAKTELELAKRYVDKEKLAVRRKETANQPTSNNVVRKAERKLVQKSSLYQIAVLNMKNKQADCKTLKLQNDLDEELEKSTSRKHFINIKKSEISTIRLEQRMENAKQLTTQHNQLANDLVGRDRVVQLCYAQKYIAEQEELKLRRQANRVSIWKNKNQSGQYNKQLTIAEQEYDRQREVAWQAEMGYLEHVWHLKEKPEVNALVNDIFNRQNELLAVPLINKPKTPSEDNNSIATNAAAVLEDVTISTTTDTRGEVELIQLQADQYEIIVDKKGNKRYVKNGKPITPLTYRFETQRKFGEMLEAISEENEKQSLWDFFKEKIQR